MPNFVISEVGLLSHPYFWWYASHMISLNFFIWILQKLRYVDILITLIMKVLLFYYFDLFYKFLNDHLSFLLGILWSYGFKLNVKKCLASDTVLNKWYYNILWSNHLIIHILHSIYVMNGCLHVMLTKDFFP